MEYISILGLFSLLFIAWLLSYHKRKINIKQIFWGIGLQFLFAVIILKNDVWSFIGMGILGTLIITFILKDINKKPGGGWRLLTVVVFICIIFGTGFYYLGNYLGGKYIGYVLGLIVLLIFLNIICAYLIQKYSDLKIPEIYPILSFFPKWQTIRTTFFKWNIPIQKYTGVLLIIGGIAYLITNSLNGPKIFDSLSSNIAFFLSLSDYGAEFLFGNLVQQKYFHPSPDAFWPGFGFQFAFKVLPTIIFFGGLMSVLYYFGIMQVIIEALSKFMRWTIGTSGAETLSCTANIFVGQTEAPLLIKPFLDNMTRSELLTIMVGGFATIAGGVLAGYIAMGIPPGHLIAASVMAAPSALIIGKIIYPELQHSQTAGDLKLPDIKVGSNPIEAATNGIIDGMKLAMNVGAMLIGFIALIAVADLILNVLDSWIDGSKFIGGKYYEYPSSGMSPASGEYSGFFPGSLRTFFGTVLRPIAFLMGVSWKEAALVGNLIGIKLSLNEFVAYGTLTSYMQDGVLSQRAVIISTYALCGFANFASIGIQIGGISAISPKRKTDLAKIGLKAMFGGAIVSMITATIAGILL